MYWSNSRRIGISRPQRETWSAHGGEAHRAEIDGVEGAERLDAVGGHHRTGLQVPLARPVELLPLELDAVPGRRRFQDPHTLGHDFLADPVSGNQRDLQRIHAVGLVVHPATVEFIGRELGDDFDAGFGDHDFVFQPYAVVADARVGFQREHHTGSISTGWSKL